MIGAVLHDLFRDIYADLQSFEQMWHDHIHLSKNKIENILKQLRRISTEIWFV